MNTIPDIFCLDPNYSTTRRLTNTRPTHFLKNEKSKPKGDLHGSARGREEGGLQTQNYFKLNGPSVESLNSLPLITIITSVFNAERTLEETILSVIGQSYSNVEYIIIDGGSTDGSLDIIKKYQHAIDYWVSEPDAGIYDAWNKGVLSSQGEWLCFLGADDYLWNAEAVSDMAKELTKVSENTCVAYGQVMLLNEQAQSICPVGEPWSDIKDRFKQVMCIPHQGVMHRRFLFERHGVFDESFRIAGDYEILLRELRNNDAVFVEGVILAGMRQGGVSSTPTNSLKALREIRKAQKLHGLQRLGKIWFLALIRSYIKVWLWKILSEEQVKKILDSYRKMMKLPLYWTKL